MLLFGKNGDSVISVHSCSVISSYFIAVGNNHRECNTTLTGRNFILRGMFSLWCPPGGQPTCVCVGPVSHQRCFAQNSLKEQRTRKSTFQRESVELTLVFSVSNNWGFAFVFVLDGARGCPRSPFPGLRRQRFPAELNRWGSVFSARRRCLRLIITEQVHKCGAYKWTLLIQ